MRAKLAAEEHQASTALPTAEEEEQRPFAPRIFNILEYIQQPWGLGMMLYPVQQFIVKLYYHLPLDDQNKTIEVRDMFATKVIHHFTEKEYLKYLYNEGRCNIGEQDHERRELCLAIGRRGGKCVSGDTLVSTDLGLIPIAELGEAPEEDFADLSVGVSQEAGRQARSTAFYNGGVKPTFTIKSKCGYRVTGTANHRVKVMTEAGRVDWRYLDQVRPSDMLAVNRSTDLWVKDPLDLWGFTAGGGYKEWEPPLTLDEKVGNLLGYLVGDGSWTDDRAIKITVEHPETWEHLKRLFTSIFGGYRVQMDLRTENTGRIEFCGVGVRRFFDDLGWKIGCARDEKMVPWAILRSSKPVVCAFLRGLFETDGRAEGGGRRITFSSASFRLAHEVQLLLLNLGIVSSVRKKWCQTTQRHYANLALKGDRSRTLFASLISFDSEKKRLPMLAALSVAQEGKSDTESIPHQQQQIRDWIESIPKRNPARGELGWGRSTLREALGNACKDSGEDLTYGRLRRALGVAKELSAGQVETAHFENLLRLDYFFDPVASVERGEDQVYDLTVPDGESFVANGLTNHNTTLSGIFSSYEIYRLLNLQNPQSYYGLPNGNRIQIISVATDKDQAGLLFNEVSSHLAKCEYFEPYISNNTQSYIQFRTPYDIEKFGPTTRLKDGKFQTFNGKATLRVTFKSCIAKGLRGAGNIVIILDEMAHFQDKGQSSAKDIYDAVTPSAAAFSPKGGNGLPMRKRSGEEYPVESRIICISSPLNKSGKFYELYHLAMSRGPGSENVLAIQAPTWEVNPTLPSSYYRQKYHADAAVFMTEHGAQFSDRVRGWIEREIDLIECIDPNRKPVDIGLPRYPHQMGIDVGMVGDGTAIFVTHVEGDHIVLDYYEYWQAGVDWRESNPHLGGRFSTEYSRTLANVERLDFEEIAEWIHKLTKRFYITDGLFDRWNGIPLEQALLKRGLTQFRSEFFQRDLTSKMYQSAKMLMFDKKLILFDQPRLEHGKHSLFIQELLNLQAEQFSKNIVVVSAPDAVGHHDDMSDAFIRAVWLSTDRMRNQKHIYGAHPSGFAGSAPSMTAGRYQMMRARKHGGFSERTVPRNLGIRLRRTR